MDSELSQAPGAETAQDAESLSDTPVSEGAARHPLANTRESTAGNWFTDVVTKIKEVRRISDGSGSRLEQRVRRLADGEAVPFDASAVPNDMPEHDWLPVE